MNKAVLFSTLAAALAVSAGAFAGQNVNNTAVASSGYGYGGVHDARVSADTKQAVSCYLGTYVSAYYDSSTINYISCSATNSSGVVAYCYVNNPPATWVTQVAGINESSWLYFYNDTSHHCLGISTSQGSANL
jgi:hypothetical protein